MRVIPETIEEKISFCQAHLQWWADNASAIGTTPEQVAALAAKTAAARAAHRAQLEAQSVAQAATAALQHALDVMTRDASVIVMQIRTQAAIEGESVYALAKIAASAKPSPIAEPGEPYGFRLELQQIGTLLINWKCHNPRGAGSTIYQVYRQIGGAGKFEYLGATGKKKYLDTTIPAGTSMVAYQIRAMRSTKVGPWAQFNVNFGMDGSMGEAMLARMREAA